jgi:hypothetical protein
VEIPKHALSEGEISMLISIRCSSGRGEILKHARGGLISLGDR